DGKGQVWSADDEQAVPAQNARTDLKLQRLRTRSGNRPGPLLPGNNGQLWFLGETVHGLSPEIEFKDGKDNDRFSPLSGVEDTRGHLWVASLGQGLTEWIPDPSWRRWYPENFNGEAAAQVIRDRQGNAILGTDKNLYRLDARSGKWIRLTHDEHRYYYLYPLDDGSMLASLRDLGLVRLNPDGAIVEHLADPAHPQPEPRQILRDGKGRIWVAAKRALLRLDGQPGSFQVHEQPLPGISAADPVQAVALATDAAGHISVGYTNGVAWLDDAGQWHLLDTDRPADWVRSMAISGGDIWLAHRHPGFYSLLRRHAGAWHVT